MFELAVKKIDFYNFVLFGDTLIWQPVITSNMHIGCILVIIKRIVMLYSSWPHQQGIFVHTTAAHWIFSLFRTIICKL